ncbi:MAG TPA: ribose 5-phosphate isomerase B [Dehalococcoidales bacterium]
MRLAIGSDHRGLALKNRAAEMLKKAGHTYEDFGVFTEERADYPQIAKKVGQAVAGGKFERGILVCGTGIGMCMAANKVKGIRAAMAFNTFSASRARQHNDANILCLGGENDQSQLPEMINAFLTTKFEGGQHIQRLQMIKEMEE